MRGVLALLLAPAVAAADANVSVTLTPAGQQLWQDLGLTSADDLIQRVNDKIDAYYQVTAAHRSPRPSSASPVKTLIIDKFILPCRCPSAITPRECPIFPALVAH